MRGRKFNTLKNILSRKVIDGDCWMFWGATDRAGYGKASYNGKPYLIHRLSAHFYLGLDLGSKELVLHKNECRFKNCFNPAHIYIGSQQDNLDDYSEIREKRKLCSKGHALIGNNVIVNRMGIKVCRQCKRDYERSRYREKNNPKFTRVRNNK